jgi:hypothetical protein
MGRNELIGDNAIVKIGTRGLCIATNLIRIQRGVHAESKTQLTVNPGIECRNQGTSSEIFIKTRPTRSTLTSPPLGPMFSRVYH